MQGIPTYIGHDESRKPMTRMTPREAVARIFPVHDRREMADRLIAWLDHCGYQIVDKDQVSIVPPAAADEDQRILEFLGSPT
jgi:hypothetical protein